MTPQLIKHRQADRGFGVLEVIIALAIITMCATLYFASIRSTADQATRLNARHNLILQAEKIMDALRANPAEFRGGTARSSGQFADGMQWSIDFTPYAEANNPADQTENRSIQLQTVTVTTAYAGQRPVALQSIFAE